MKNLEIFYAKARNSGNLSHFHGTRTLTLSWMHVKYMPDNGPRKRMLSSTLFPNGLSRLGMWLHAESDDLNILSTPDTSPFFRDPDVVHELSRLHENFVIVPADKASNNYTFVCKKHYVDILIEELGLYSLPGNPTYNLTDFSASEVLDNHKSVLTSFGIQTNNEELNLPYIYWIPKMHKIHINIDSLRVHQSVRPSLCPFYSQNCLHILSKVSRSTARQPTLGVGSIRCGSSKIQKSF